MVYIQEYAPSPVGTITMASDRQALAGLWIDGQKHYMYKLPGKAEKASLPVFDKCRAWLDAYFAGLQPEIDFPLAPVGSEFQKKVWQALLAIPYGATTTYGDIAKAIGCKSAQAVGGAVGKNPISIIVPCHRVIGKNGSMTGYDGGIDKKEILLSIEKSHPA